MATYYVMQGGTAANKAAAVGGDVTDDSLYMSFATLRTELSGMTHGDTVEMNGYGGTIVMGGNFSLNSITSTAFNNFTLQGDRLYPPTLDETNGGGSNYQIRSTAVNNTTYQHFNIINGGTDAIGFETSGTGHVVRNVHVDGGENQAFQNEGTCEVTYYDVSAKNITDDGISLHDSSVVTVYGANISGCADGIHVSGSGTFVGHNVRCFGNSEFDFGMTGAGITGASAKFYDSEFGGAVVGHDQAAGTDGVCEFYRCKFHCNAISTVVNMTFGSVQFGTAATTASTFNVKFSACLFTGGVANKAQLFIYRADGTADVDIENCTFSQTTQVTGGYGARIFAQAADADVDVNNCIFYNLAEGIDLTQALSADLTNCRFDSCTTKYSNTPTNNTGEITDATGFEHAAIGDYRLAVASAMLGAGVSRTISNNLDVEGRLFAGNDVGCYTYSTGRPSFSGVRPSV